MQYNSYTAGTDVELSITVPTLDTGATLASIAYDLLDTTGTAVQSNINVPVNTVTGGAVPITIAGAQNVLPVDATSAVYTVEVSFTDNNGKVLSATERYIVDTGTIIEKLTNSFGTFNELVLTLQTMPHITELNSITENNFSKYAVEAWRRLTRLNFRYKILDSNTDELSYLISRRDGFMYIDDIKEISQSEYDSFPQDFKTALMRAICTEYP